MAKNGAKRKSAKMRSRAGSGFWVGQNVENAAVSADSTISAAVYARSRQKEFAKLGESGANGNAPAGDRLAAT
jgi:hypothetical protein